MTRPEILAPAGSQESLTAALRCGADAVYLGTKRFNARRGASNFDEASLHAAAFLCHTYGAKLYLTLNTLVSDAETDDVRRTLSRAAEAGVDALMSGRTTFVIAHRLSTIMNANCIMVVEGGHIIERGDHGELIDQKGRYYQL